LIDFVTRSIEAKATQVSGASLNLAFKFRGLGAFKTWLGDCGREASSQSASMTDSQESIHAALIQDILLYLEAHPQATDNLEGIIGWWLSPELRPCDPTLLLSVLDSLVSKGLIARVHLSDGQLLYQSLERSSGKHRIHKP
jgi:hypothetical protein